MFIKKVICVFLIVSVAIVNIVFTVCNSNKIVNLVSLKSEAFANNDETSGGELGPLQKWACGVTEKVIIGHDDKGNPIFNVVVHDGEKGECAGRTGSCSPYPCTRLYW